MIVGGIRLITYERVVTLMSGTSGHGASVADALTFAEDRFYSQTAGELEAIPDATGKLVRLIEISCSPGDGMQAWLDEWVLWLDLWTRAFRDAEVSKQRQVLDQRWRDTIAAIVRDGQY